MPNRREIFLGIFVLMRELNSVNILKAVENGLQAIPDGKPLLREKSKEEAITLIKDSILAARARKVRIRAIAKTVSEASGRQIGFRDVQAAVAKWEHRHKKIGRPKNACFEVRRRRTAKQELTTESDPPKIDNEGAVDDPFPIEAEIEELPESRATPAPETPTVALTLPAKTPKRHKQALPKTLQMDMFGEAD